MTEPTQWRTSELVEISLSLSSLLRLMANISSGVARLKEALHESVVCQFNLAQNITDYYGAEARLQLREVDR